MRGRKLPMNMFSVEQIVDILNWYWKEFPNVPMDHANHFFDGVPDNVREFASAFYRTWQNPLYELGKYAERQHVQQDTLLALIGAVLKQGTADKQSEF